MDDERSSFNTHPESERERVVREVKLRSRILQSTVSTRGFQNEGCCSVIIGDESAGKASVSTLPPGGQDRWLAVPYLLSVINTYADDVEIVTTGLYCVAIMVLDVTVRHTFRESHGVELVQRLLKAYPSNLQVVRCCCSVCANMGPFLITPETLALVEALAERHNYDEFLATALCATYANFARANTRSVVDRGTVERVVGLLRARRITDVQYSALADVSNIARNSNAGQRRCVERNVHEAVAACLLEGRRSLQYWKVACNAYGCLAVNGFGNEQKRVATHARTSGLVDAIVDQLQSAARQKRPDPNLERVYGCLAKIALVYPIVRVPRLSWLCMRQTACNTQLPPALVDLYQTPAFRCHVCKTPCDPAVMRTVRLDEKLVLMSYCSLACWKRRHAL